MCEDSIIPTFGDNWIYFKSDEDLFHNEVYYTKPYNEVELWCDYHLNKPSKKDLLDIKIIEYDHTTNTSVILINQTIRSYIRW